MTLDLPLPLGPMIVVKFLRRCGVGPAVRGVVGAFTDELWRNARRFSGGVRAAAGGGGGALEGPDHVVPAVALEGIDFQAHDSPPVLVGLLPAGLGHRGGRPGGCRALQGLVQSDPGTLAGLRRRGRAAARCKWV